MGLILSHAVSVFADDAALTILDEYPDQERFATIGMDGQRKNPSCSLHFARKQYQADLGT